MPAQGLAARLEAKGILVGNRSTKRTVNRWVVLAVAAVAGALDGAPYMWSIFQNPLMELHGWTSGDVTFAYSLFYAFVLVGAFVGGPLQKVLKPKYVLLIAGLFLGGGFLLTGFADSVPLLYLFYSVIGGLGDGFIYSAAISAATKWFPDKKGLANGICVGCIGLAPLLFAPMGNALIDAFGVQGAFKANGILMIGIFLVISWFLEAPEKGWAPAGWTPPVADGGASKVANVVGKDLTVRQMVKQPAYWAMLVMVACACTSGMMMTSQASTIAQVIANVTAAQAALQVGLLAVCSFVGRLLLGWLSDRIGRFNAFLIVFAVTAIDMLFLFGLAHDFATFLFAMGLAGFGFGGAMAIMPPLVSDSFGASNFSVNYPFVYMGYTFASFIGPMLAAGVYQASGTYDQVFFTAGVIAIAGFALTLVTKRLCLDMHRKAAR